MFPCCLCRGLLRITQALRKGLIEREANDTGGVPRGKSSCPDRLAEAIGPVDLTQVKPMFHGSIVMWRVASGRVQKSLKSYRSGRVGSKRF